MIGKKKSAPNLDNLPQGFGINWQSRSTFELQGYHFDIPNSMMEFLKPTERSHPDSFYLGKTTPMISADLKQLQERMPSRILELGVYQGGSAAFLQNQVGIAQKDLELALELGDSGPGRSPFVEAIHRTMPGVYRTEPMPTA